MKGFFKYNFKALTGIILCFIALGLMLLWFSGQINKRLEKTAQIYMDENVDALSTVFYTKLDDQLIMLESQARYFRDVDLSDYNLMKETILSTRGIGAFKTIGVANSFGATMNYNGKSSGNILLTDYYKTAMSGTNAISETTMTDEDGASVLVLAVPIMHGDNAVGVVYGTFTEEILNSLVDTVNFADKSTNILINKNGTILARSTGANCLPANTSNLFDIVPAAKKTKKDENSKFTYRFENEKYTMVMTPVGAHEWYFASILPYSVVGEQTSAVAKYVLTEMIGIIVVAGIMFLCIYSLVRYNADKEMTLTKKAEVDSLTGLLNKGAFEMYTSAEIAAADETKYIAYYIIDLDNFKTVNDTLGHAVGDKVLSEVGKSLAGIFCNEKHVGRIGGDEFAALWTAEASKQDAEETVRRIGDRICESVHDIYSANGLDVDVSASVGISVYPQAGKDYAGMYKSADQALYKVKKKGKNGYEIFEPEVAQ